MRRGVKTRKFDNQILQALSVSNRRHIPKNLAPAIAPSLSRPSAHPNCRIGRSFSPRPGGCVHSGRLRPYSTSEARNWDDLGNPSIFPFCSCAPTAGSTFIMFHKLPVPGLAGCFPYRPSCAAFYSPATPFSVWREFRRSTKAAFLFSRISALSGFSFPSNAMPQANKKTLNFFSVFSHVLILLHPRLQQPCRCNTHSSCKLCGKASFHDTGGIPPCPAWKASSLLFCCASPLWMFFSWVLPCIYTSLVLVK